MESDCEKGQKHGRYNYLM